MLPLVKVVSSLAPSLLDKAFQALEASSYPKASDSPSSLESSAQLLVFLGVLLLNVAFALAFNRYNFSLNVLNLFLSHVRFLGRNSPSSVGNPNPNATVRA